MIRIDCKQGSYEWHTARAAIPTASRFHNIVTPAGKLSASATGYMHELLAAWFLGPSADSANTAFMQRGSEMEPEAVAYYELKQSVDTKSVGFVTRDDGLVGCSPDRFVADDGGAEIKVRSAHVHIGLLLGVEPKALLQVQGCMWLCAREWWDLCSYNPVLPTAIVRIERDEAMIGKLQTALDQFVERMLEARERLTGLGCEQVQPKIDADDAEFDKCVERQREAERLQELIPSS